MSRQSGIKLLCAAAVLWLLAACGQSGPLYLPDEAEPDRAGEVEDDESTQ